MRSTVVSIGDKQIKIEEKRIKELKELGAKYKDTLDKIIGAGNIDDIKTVAINLLGNNLTELFQGLTEDDIDNAYPSEIEALIGAFIDINFTGIKKVILPLMSFTMQGLKK